MCVCVCVCVYVYIILVFVFGIGGYSKPRTGDFLVYTILQIGETPRFYETKAVFQFTQMNTV